MKFRVVNHEQASCCITVLSWRTCYTLRLECRHQMCRFLRAALREVKKLEMKRVKPNYTTKKLQKIVDPTPWRSWEANSSSATQEIPRILCKPMVQYVIQKSPPPVPTLVQIDPVHACTPFHPTSLKSILILSSRLRLALRSGFLLSGFPTKTLYASLLFAISATCPVHLSLLDLIIRMIFGEEKSMDQKH